MDLVAVNLNNKCNERILSLEKAVGRLEVQVETILESVSVQRNLSQVLDDKFPTMDEIKKDGMATKKST